jgi:hypothetical protein
MWRQVHVQLRLGGCQTAFLAAQERCLTCYTIESAQNVNASARRSACSRASQTSRGDGQREPLRVKRVSDGVITAQQRPLKDVENILGFGLDRGRRTQPALTRSSCLAGEHTPPGTCAPCSKQCEQMFDFRADNSERNYYMGSHKRGRPLVLPSYGAWAPGDLLDLLSSQARAARSYAISIIITTSQSWSGTYYRASALWRMRALVTSERCVCSGLAAKAWRQQVPHRSSI